MSDIIEQLAECKSLDKIQIPHYPQGTSRGMEIRQEEKASLTRGQVVCRMQTLISSSLTIPQHVHHRRCCMNSTVSKALAECPGVLVQQGRSGRG